MSVVRFQKRSLRILIVLSCVFSACLSQPAINQDAYQITNPVQGFPTRSKNSNVIRFFYIDAGTGSSSGGHTALEADGIVFHFQNYPDGFFRIERLNYREFYRRYSLLENRTIYAHEIRLSSTDFRRVFRTINRMYIVQLANFELLSQLRSEKRLWQSWQSNEQKLSIPLAAYFLAEQTPTSNHVPFPAPVIAAAQKAQGHLKKSLQAQNLKPANRFDFRLLKRSRYPAALNLPSLLWRRQIQARLAVDHILLNGNLNTEHLFIPSKLYAKNHPIRLAMQLDSEQIKTLKLFQSELARNIQSYLKNNPGRRGNALLLATLRYRVVEMSIRQRELIIADPFPALVIRLDQLEFQKQGQISKAILEQMLARTQQVMHYVLQKAKLNEFDYNGLENSAAQIMEIQRARLHRQPIRVPIQTMVPQRAASLDPARWLDNQSIKTLRQQANERLHTNSRELNQLQDRLKEVYSYSLLQRNCVTELLVLLNQSFESSSIRQASLGGTLDPTAGFNFIPFAAFNQFSQNLRISKSWRIPSYRLRRLYYTSGKGYSVPDWLSRLRESNTISSQLYNPRREDSAFLFFSDDLYWLRPLAGTINMLYGLAYSIYGLVRLPFDQGTALGRGLEGMLWSAPEILLFNVRKGSYQYAPEIPELREDWQDPIGWP